MGDEPVLADLDPRGKAALDHLPAERAFEKTEQQNAGERRGQPARQAAAQREIQKRPG